MTNLYLDIPTFDDFGKVLDGTVYHALPDDWWVGTSDVIGSTKAVEAGRYKDVNMVGASVICAVSNVLGHSDYPFLFGGDGASFACPPDQIDAVRDAMASTATWAAETLELELRVGLVRIGDIRAAGHDVRIARYAVSNPVSYAMFAGGGMQWAEDQMKQGNNMIPAAPPGSRPDLTGLSCRWSPIRAEGSDVILSIIVAGRDDRTRFDETVRTLFAILDDSPRKSSPIPENGPGVAFPPPGMHLEAEATKHKEGGYIKAWLKALYIALIAAILMKTGWKLGAFDPRRYRDYTGYNTDFRKFGDGLWMTVNCSLTRAEEVEALLHAAELQGDIHFGTHRQRSAIMTCIVPSITSDAHFHFLDGGEGGYTAAARAFKAKRKRDQAIDTSPANA
ncbi:DUF3095 domain-containing protein [Thalassospira indica]|uniref:DUF3095 domain-containing protein n=1 Tax=Thalassospira indica TaxID=1891279 RepID=A0ABN5NJD9_9PROT|nr:DUF3095 domain-containing protein [Thalassospira indica]AXO15701.1 DUF3095 domain-containing protein [Thalassospira indica]